MRWFLHNTSNEVVSLLLRLVDVTLQLNALILFGVLSDLSLLGLEWLDRWATLAKQIVCADNVL